VKFSHVNPKKTGGEGNVPYARTEYVAEEITAYFNLDLVQIRSFNLDETAEKLLVVLSIYKILKSLKDDLRLRTACDLKIDGKLTVRNEEDKAMDFPEYSAVEGKLKDLIEKCTSKNLFASPSITKIDYK
jgi:CRISPR-associated protein Csb1